MKRPKLTAEQARKRAQRDARKLAAVRHWMHLVVDGGGKEAAYRQTVWHFTRLGFHISQRTLFRWVQDYAARDQYQFIRKPTRS